MANHRPQAEILWEKYSYNPLTGRLHSTLDDYEYRGNLTGKYGNSHQLSVSGCSRFPYGVCVFAWLHGRWPTEGLQIDHIDRNPFNHKAWNLREVTAAENLRNRTKKYRPRAEKCQRKAKTIKRIQREFKAPRE